MTTRRDFMVVTLAGVGAAALPGVAPARVLENPYRPGYNPFNEDIIHAARAHGLSWLRSFVAGLDSIESRENRYMVGQSNLPFAIRALQYLEDEGYVKFVHGDGMVTMFFETDNYGLVQFQKGVPDTPICNFMVFAEVTDKGMAEGRRMHALVQRAQAIEETHDA